MTKTSLHVLGICFKRHDEYVTCWTASEYPKNATDEYLTLWLPKPWDNVVRALERD